MSVLKMSVLIFGILILNFSCLQKKGKDKMAMENFSLVQDGHNLTASFAGEKALSYFYDKTQYKPYVKELFSPNGINVLLDSPDDHKHHHALMYAIKVDGTNFWEEVELSGRQEPQNTSKAVSESGEKNSLFSFASQINWVRPNDQAILLMENRTIKFEIPREKNARILTWTSELNVPEGKAFAELGGNHYHGLGVRFIHSMDKNGDFFTAGNKQGEIFRGEERLIPDSWCAYSAPAGEGKDITVAMFRSPENIGDNTVWFTMKTPFAYLSATKAWNENPHILKAGETLSLTYGVAVWDGKISFKKINEIYEYWKNTL